MYNICNAKENTKQETKKEERWVITRDGIRMTYSEYREMIESERN